jgi:putative exosortase-associated protein (TIGR04073 family)
MLSCGFEECQSDSPQQTPFLVDEDVLMRRVVPWSSAALLALVMMGTTPARADEPQPSAPRRCPICQAANNQNTPYPQRAGSVLMRGATNATFGWTELLLQPSAEAEQGGNLAAGVGRGLGLAFKRTAVGFGELFTFWVPKGKQGYPVLSEDCPICSLPTAPAPPAKTESSP